MAIATWRGATLAQSDTFELVEGNIYFPPDSLTREFFIDSPTTSICPWKGTASYYSIVVEGETNKDAAWYYPEPKEAAKEIAGHIAFWKGVKVEK